MSVIRRRGPVVVRPPFSTAGPNRWIPRIRTVIGRSVLTAGLVIAVRPPHAVVAANTKVPSSPKVVSGQSNKPVSYSFKVASPRTNLPRVKPFSSRVVLTSFTQNGKVYVTRPPLNVKVFKTRPQETRVVIGNSGSYSGYVNSIHVRRPSLVASKRPSKPNVVLSSFSQNGKVYVTRHAFRTVTPVTSVRPKVILVRPDRRLELLRRSFFGVAKISKGRSPIPIPGNVLTACVDLTKTWRQHYVTNGWTTPRQQVNAGYPVYCEPALTTASYTEVFDFGATFNDVVVGISWQFSLVAGSVGITSTLEFSTDNVTFTAPVAGPSALASSVRYARVTMNFSGNDKAVIKLYNFICGLSIHREIDSGNGTAVSTDATGTLFTFNKAFKTVDSITVTPQTTNDNISVVNFAGGANPTTFRVLVFDSTGARVTVPINWKARGTT